MTKVHLKTYTIKGALTFDTKIIFVSFFFLSHVLAIIIYYISIESLKPQNSSCENCFEIGHCVTIEMVPFIGMLPLSGRCHISNVLQSYGIKTFDNLDETHIIRKV